MRKPRILVGITGCIAAYKACELVRRLQDLGAEVRVAMTSNASDFVTPLTFETLSRNRVLVGDCHADGEPIGHISLAEWADLYVIAPCTANMLAKVACGIADDIVSTMALVAHERLAVVPAMNVHMFDSPAAQANISILRSRGVAVVDPDSGYLACGEIGRGRFPDPAGLATTILDEILAARQSMGADEAVAEEADAEEVREAEDVFAGKAETIAAENGDAAVEAIAAAEINATEKAVAAKEVDAEEARGVEEADAPAPFSDAMVDETMDINDDAFMKLLPNVPQDLSGKRVMVTAGPTREPIDPVRFISNRSSGKMGYAIARAAASRGADVTLISGPVSLETPPWVRFISVETAQEMKDAAIAAFGDSDIAIFSAAVSDMRPKNPSDHKLKKGSDAKALRTIEMKENDDILAYCGKAKGEDQFIIGFAAETDDIELNALSKLKSKGADLIVANDVSGGMVFGDDEDKAIFVSETGVEELPSMEKTVLADKILDFACANMF